MAERDLAMGLAEYERRFLAGARRGLGQAGLAILADAVMDMPTVPLKEGTLRGSGSVFVDGKLLATSPGAGTPATDAGDLNRPGTLEALVGFNTPYAAYQHEGMRKDGTHVVRNYSEPSSGVKFLENKLNANRDKYLAILNGEIRKATGNG